MGQIDDEERILSEDIAGHSDSDSFKLVPVAESIRYRKRAQSAEKKAEALAEQLTQARSEVSRMVEQLSDIQLEQKLTCKLATAGVVDMEAAMLIAKARVEGERQADFDGVVEQLKREKQYLFGDSKEVVAAKKTAGAKDQMQSNQMVIERAAKKAATTGNRADLQEYLKLRRSFV